MAITTPGRKPARRRPGLRKHVPRAYASWQALTAIVAPIGFSPPELRLQATTCAAMPDRGQSFPVYLIHQTIILWWPPINLGQAGLPVFALEVHAGSLVIYGFRRWLVFTDIGRRIRFLRILDRPYPRGSRCRPGLRSRPSKPQPEASSMTLSNRRKVGLHRTARGAVPAFPASPRSVCPVSLRSFRRAS